MSLLLKWWFLKHSFFSLQVNDCMVWLFLGSAKLPTTIYYIPHKFTDETMLRWVPRCYMADVATVRWYVHPHDIFTRVMISLWYSRRVIYDQKNFPLFSVQQVYLNYPSFIQCFILKISFNMHALISASIFTRLWRKTHPFCIWRKLRVFLKNSTSATEDPKEVLLGI